MVDDMNPRAAARLNELGLQGFPTTFFDAGFREILGGESDTALYTNEILVTGARNVATDDLILTVELEWLGGEGGPGDDLEITVSIVVDGSLSFSFPNGLPYTLTPDEETNFDVVIAGTGTGVPVSGTGQLHYAINGGTYATTDMTEALPNEYVATLPALACGNYLDFYFSATEATHGVIYDHQVLPYHAYPSDLRDTVFADGFESDLGWLISGGQWEIGTPTGGGGNWGPPDPDAAYSGENVLGYNLDGDYGNFLPEYHVTSPAINCAGLIDTELRFWRWLGVERPAYDHAYLRLSTNGTSWTTLWENEVDIKDTMWTEQVFDISGYADGQPTVYLRFTMGTTDPGYNGCGWNIDELSVVGNACKGPYVCGDANADLIANITDAVYLIEYIFNDGPAPNPYESGDANCDGIANITDGVYLITYIFGGGPPPCDTDDNGAPDC
ncbi:MAG: hypothetical protein ABIJ61_09605 [bacterium]